MFASSYALNLTLKARAETLEEQNRKMRSKMGIVLEKTKTDDALVDALRGELNEVRQSLYQSVFCRLLALLVPIGIEAF